MYSNKSEYSHRRQYSDRSSRQWDDYDDRREERREPQRETPQDSHNKYGRDGRRSTERASRISEFSDSPKRSYSNDSTWSRKSPVRRRMSSPAWDGSEQKRQRFAEDGDSDYRYRCEPHGRTCRQSTDSGSHAHKDFKDTPPQDEDFRYRRSPPDSRHRHRHEEFAYRQRHDDLTYRRLPESSKDRDGHKRSRSQEKTRLQDRPTKNYANPRERTDSPSTSTYHEDYRQGRARFPLNGTSGQSFESKFTQGAAVPDQRPTKGFQRFLDVLNKGVNVDVLTKIVGQTSTEAQNRRSSPSSFVNSDDCPRSPSAAERQRGSHSNNRYWNESEASSGPVPSQPHQRSLSPRRGPLSDEKCLQRGDGEQSCSRSKSPSGMEKVTLTPEDEHKQKQMRDVLQAIGLDLGFEELGQMSHRIQERLYGKKDSDWGQKASKEGGTRQASSLKRHSRSSSTSRSSFSPVPRDCYSYSAQSDGTEVGRPQVHESVEYSQKTSSSSLQDSKKCESDSQDSTAALQPFSFNSTYGASQPPSAPVMPVYSPVNSPLLPYTAQPPPCPPVMPYFGPSYFLPPFLPQPHNQPLNVFPPQTSHLFPPQMSHRRPPLLPLPDSSPVQPVNATQTTKNVSRTRYLQVIDTKQSG